MINPPPTHTRRLSSDHGGGGEKIGDHFNVSTRAPHTVFDIRRVLDRSAVFQCRSFHATRKCRLGRRVARRMCPAGFPGLGADQLATHTHASLFVATTAGGEKLFNDVQRDLKRAPRRRSAPNVPCGVPLGSALINSSLNTHASLYVTTTGGEEMICNHFRRPKRVLHTRRLIDGRVLDRSAMSVLAMQHGDTVTRSESVDRRVAPPVTGRYHAGSTPFNAGTPTTEPGSPESNVGTTTLGITRGVDLRRDTGTRGRGAYNGRRFPSRNTRPSSQSEK